MEYGTIAGVEVSLGEKPMMDESYTGIHLDPANPVTHRKWLAARTKPYEYG